MSSVIQRLRTGGEVVKRSERTSKYIGQVAAHRLYAKAPFPCRDV